MSLTVKQYKWLKGMKAQLELQLQGNKPTVEVLTGAAFTMLMARRTLGFSLAQVLKHIKSTDASIELFEQVEAEAEKKRQASTPPPPPVDDAP